MKLTLIQANPLVGDVEGNLQRLLQWLETYQGHTDLLMLPELYLSGYPPRDLLSRRAFLHQLDAAVNQLVEATCAHPGLAVLVGTPRRHHTDTGFGICNSALLIADGNILLEQHKALLPTYDVFDERRHFDAVQTPQLASWGGLRLGVCICEDAWNEAGLWTDNLYDYDPVAALVQAGADIILNLSASPFHRAREQTRYHVGFNHARKHDVPFVLVNQVGANDELIFDGHSFALSASGELLAELPGFKEAFVTIDLANPTPQPAPQGAFGQHSEVDNVRSALVLGVRDYFRKVGARTALIGLSGGIDSSLVACIAAEALTPENVYGVTMPGPYSSAGSQDDSAELAARLGIHFEVLPITTIFQTFLETLQPVFQDQPPDVTEENIQARIRGNLLMAIANKFGHLVLATSNKSETAVGYATLYGDMTGALAVIADILKGQVYELARCYNQPEELIPSAVLTKAPSAELRQDQKDSDSLPPYDLLDAVIRHYVEDGQSPEEVIAEGYEASLVHWVVSAIKRNEYKRLQAPPTLRITRKSFGSGRRIPVAARYQA